VTTCRKDHGRSHEGGVKVSRIGKCAPHLLAGKGRSQCLLVLDLSASRYYSAQDDPSHQERGRMIREGNADMSKVGVGVRGTAAARALARLQFSTCTVLASLGRGWGTRKYGAWGKLNRLLQGLWLSTLEYRLRHTPCILLGHRIGQWLDLTHRAQTTTSLTHAQVSGKAPERASQASNYHHTPMKSHSCPHGPWPATVVCVGAVMGSW
jgi:hypothetical protein